MRVYDMIVAERLRTADMLSDLTVAQWDASTLCAEWSVHEVAAHLVTYLRFGQLKLYAGIATMAADFDRLNLSLTGQEAQRPSQQLVSRLRRFARSRVTIPRSGYDPVLTDLVLHDLDIRVPLGIPRTMPEDRLAVAFGHLTARPSSGFAMSGRLAGLRIHTTDSEWTAGDGPMVEGPTESVLLAIGGRPSAVDEVTGDGVPLLRSRLSPPRASAPRRLLAPLMVLLRPPPRERRRRNATVPT